MKEKTTPPAEIPAYRSDIPSRRIMIAVTALSGVLPLQAQTLAETEALAVTGDAPAGAGKTPTAEAVEYAGLDDAALAEEIRLRRPASREIPAAVKEARVLSQVAAPQAAGGAPLTISLIEPPLLPAPTPQPRVVAAFTEEQRAAIRAAAPLQILNFAPTIMVYPDGVSLVQWGIVDKVKSYQEFTAWVPYDLTSISLAGDVEVGRTRYSVMGFAHPVTDRAREQDVPTAADLGGGYRLTKGDPANEAALEPLRALLAVYAAEGQKLTATYAALQARQLAWEQWEKENPEPPRPVEIRLWRIEPAASGPSGQ